MKKTLFSTMNLSLLLLAGMILSACGRQNSQGRLGKQEYTMQEVAHKRFSLDDSTTQVLSYIHTFEEGDSLMLASYNSPMHNICIFDVKSGKEVRKVNFQKEGPNALGNGVFGFLYHNPDSIFIYYSWGWEIALFDDKGVKKDKISLRTLPMEGQTSFVWPEILPCTNLPIKKWNDYLILQGQGKSLPDPNPQGLRSCVTALFNLAHNDIRLANPYPDIYGGEGAIWQPFAYRVTPYDLSPKGEMVLSFQADDSIRVYDLRTGKSKAYFAGYSKPYKIRPARSGSQGDVKRSIATQIQYAGIYYDKWNKLYYRLLSLPIADYNVNEETFPERNLAIVLLDETFQKVGEYNLTEKSDRYGFVFTSPEGLHINILSPDDDYMEFLTIKPQKNEVPVS